MMDFQKPQGCVNVKCCFDSMVFGYLRWCSGVSSPQLYSRLNNRQKK